MSASLSGWKYFTYSLKTGAGYYMSSPGRFFHREALRRLLTPINVSRCYEFSKTFEELQPVKEDLIFDLSSPKLLSHYLEEKVGCRVVTSDIAFDEVYSWKSMTEHKKAKPQWLLINGRMIGIKDNSFDKVFSISVLEHIADNGDAETLKELGRILKPGGRLVFTIPLAEEFRTEFSKEDAYDIYGAGQKTYHWSHFYNENTIQVKLVKGSGLTLENIYYAYGVGSMIWKKIERLGRLGFPLWILSMMIAKYGLSEITTQPPVRNDDYYLAAVVVMKKEGKGNDGQGAE